MADVPQITVQISTTVAQAAHALRMSPWGRTSDPSAVAGTGAGAGAGAGGGTAGRSRVSSASSPIVLAW